MGYHLQLLVSYVCVAHLWTRPRRPETATLFAEGFADVDFRVRSRLRDFSRCAASSARPFRGGCCRTCLNSSARAKFSTTCKLHAERDGISRSKREGIRRRLTSACEVGCFSLRACGSRHRLPKLKSLAQLFTCK